MLKTLFVLCGVLIISATGLQARGNHSFAGGRGSMAGSRPAAYRGYNRGGFAYGNHHRGHHGHRGYRGRYYYLSGVPYFYPLGFGYGYPGYYGGFYSDGFGGGYGYGGYPYNNAAYNGRVVNDNGTANGSQSTGESLPEAVQRQLAKRGYYQGSVDGQFGPASRNALSRFQKKQGLKETGKIDEATLEALGFTDQH